MTGRALISGGLLMVTATFFFMAANACAKLLIDDYHWTQIVAMRGASGLLAIIVASAAFWSTMRSAVLSRSSKPLLALRSIIEIIMFASFVMAIRAMDLTFAASLIFISPLLIVLFSGIFLGERITVLRLGAVLMGLCGVVLVLRPDQLAIERESLLWLSLSIVCLCANAVLSRKYSMLAPPFQNTVALHVIMAIGVAPFAFLFWRDVASPEVWLLFAGLGVFGAIGVWLFNLAFRFGEGGAVAPFFYAELLWAIGFDSVIWAKAPPAVMLYGAALIAVGGLLVQVFDTGARKSA